MSEKNNNELSWIEDEEKELINRILNLRDDQIAALYRLVEIKFDFNNIENVIKEIKENKQQSGHLPILIYEADSKKNLLWWLNFFEKHNKK